MGEFLFYKTISRREKSESLHDLLITAKNGHKKTKLQTGANLTWNLMLKLLKSAEAAMLIEEIETPRYERYGLMRPATVWKTTEKGLRYAKNVYDNSKLLEKVED